MSEDPPSAADPSAGDHVEAATPAREATPLERPEPLWTLFADIESLPGVGPKNAPLFKKLAGDRVRDLVFLSPTGLVDRRRRDTVLGAPEGAVATVEVLIGKHRPPPGLPKPGRNRPYRIPAADAATDFTLVFFRNDPRYLQEIAPEGSRRLVSGKVEFYDGEAQMVHPDHIVPLEQADDIPAMEPVYPLTAGLSLRVLSKAVRAALARAPELDEWLDQAQATRDGFPSWRAAVEALHAPSGAASLEPNAVERRRLAYDEMLAQQLALALARAQAVKATGRRTAGDGGLRATLLAALPFKPTGAQARAVAEIAADMASGDRMMRLLQGDVGTGKTLVAFLAMLIAVEAGGQAALMAPTEILARQHAEGLARYAEIVGVRVGLALGRDGVKARRETLEAAAAGEIDIMIGTHALFQRDVAFKDLRLAVIDEQHRFGVAQRLALAEKGEAADILMMTATPIPRTLALAQYGDMDISALDEKPPGRKPIDTRVLSLDRLDDVAARLGAAIRAGKRAYWVCPMVEDSEVLDLAAAEARARALTQLFGAERVALAHGRLPPAEKDAAMARFQAGEAQVLVATTVIEVGVDVPEATIIVIEHAERFGLAQLHQLRGRVGRGGEASSCLLLYGQPLTKAGQARLKALRDSEDGFYLAEEDLRLRGAGDLLGLRQSGQPEFLIADLERHGDLMAMARDDARLVLATDPALESLRGRALRVLLALHERDTAMALLGAG